MGMRSLMIGTATTCHDGEHSFQTFDPHGGAAGQLQDQLLTKSVDRHSSRTSTLELARNKATAACNAYDLNTSSDHLPQLRHLSATLIARCYLGSSLNRTIQSPASMQLSPPSMFFKLRNEPHPVV